MILQLFMSSPRTANLLGYAGASTALFLSTYTSLMLFTPPFKVPKILFWIPQMSFSRMYLYISKQCMETGCFSSFSQFHGEARHALNHFMATAVLYLVLGVVLNVLQSRGVTLTSLFKSAWRRIVPSSESSRLLKYSNAPNATPAQPESPSKKSAGSSSQSDVEAEQDIVDRLGGDGKCDLSSKYPIIANRVSKTYMRNGRPFQALHPTSLCLQKGQVLGL